MPENPALNEGTWHQAEEYIRKAFLDLDDASQDLKTKYSQIGFTESSTSVKRRIARVVEIPAGTKLFKLTKWQEKLERNPMSPWWSTHGSFQEDNLGARGIFEHAMLNGVSMREFARFVSAVVLEWNSLDYYVEVQTNVAIKAYWGQFAPQVGAEHDKEALKRAQMTLSTSSTNRGTVTTVQYEGSDEDIYIPDYLGGFGAWQFYIPNFNPAWINRPSVTNIQSTDQDKLATHLGIAGDRLAELKRLSAMVR